MSAPIRTREEAARAHRLIAALYEQKEDEKTLEQTAERMAAAVANFAVEDAMTNIEAETGQNVWDVAKRVREAASSCVATDMLYAFMRAHKLNKHVPLSDKIEGIYKRLDVTEFPHGDIRTGYSEYVIFGSIKGGVDIDAISCHGKNGCYGDGKTNAIYGVGDSGYINDVLLVSAKACRVLDEMEACFFNELAPNIEHLVEAFTERLWQEEFEFLYDSELAELTEENELLPEDNRGVIKMELDAGGEFFRDTNCDYTFKSANGAISFTVPPEFVGPVYSLTIHEADALVRDLASA